MSVHQNGLFEARAFIMRLRRDCELARLLKSANHGVMKAMFFGLLTVLLLAAAPLSAQTNRTIQELKTSAEKGDALDQFGLGLLYYSGKDLTNDNVEAVKWVRKAAEQNLVLAQSFLGQCYAEGIGVAKIKWKL